MFIFDSDRLFIVSDTQHTITATILAQWILTRNYTRHFGGIKLVVFIVTSSDIAAKFNVEIRRDQRTKR